MPRRVAPPRARPRFARDVGRLRTVHSVRGALAALAGAARRGRPRRCGGGRAPLGGAAARTARRLAQPLGDAGGVGRTAEAVDAGFHMVALSRSSLAAVDFGRTMLSARRYDIVDSPPRELAPLEGSHPRRRRARPARDARARTGAVRRVRRGAVVPAVDERSPAGAGRRPRADGTAAPRRARSSSGPDTRPVRRAPGSSRRSEARGFTWSHAIEADALVRAGDTTAARALVDSITRAASQSYYDRDKLLAHHVLGMLDLRAAATSRTPRANCARPSGRPTAGRAPTSSWRARSWPSITTPPRSRPCATPTWLRWTAWVDTCRGANWTGGWRGPSRRRGRTTAPPCTHDTCARRGGGRIRTFGRGWIPCRHRIKSQTPWSPPPPSPRTTAPRRRAGRSGHPSRSPGDSGSRSAARSPRS